MTTKRKWSYRLIALTLLAVFVSAGTPLAGKGKPEPPPPTPTLSFSITQLGTLGGSWSLATAMNPLGDVVGYSEMADQTEEAFVYFNNTVTMHRLRDLVTPNDQADWRWTQANPTGINSFGQISMGLSAASGGNSSAVRITLVFDEAGIVVAGQGTVLVVGPDLSGALGINEFGDITGNYGSSRAFVYCDEFGFEDIGDLGGGTAGAEAINNFGEIAGTSVNAAGELRAFLFTPGFGMEDLGIISTAGPSYEDTSWGHDLNDSGVAVGSATAGKQKGSRAQHAFREGGQGMEDLGTLGGYLSYARSINSDGAVIGAANDKDNRERQFLYTQAFGMVDLQPLITNLPADTLSIEVRQINNAGEICGNIWFNGGPSIPQAFLLTPNP